MATAKEKDTILRLIYDDHINNSPNDSYPYDSYPCSEYRILNKKSGLKEHVFSLAFKELLRLNLVHSYGPQGDDIPIEITYRGMYFHEQGGFSAIEKKKNRQSNWKRAEDLIQKLGPIVISLFTAGWTVAVFFMQRQADSTIKAQKNSIDSLTNAVQKMTTQEKSKQ